MLLSTIHISNAQTDVWSGKLDVNGSKLSLVFHMNDENPSVDSPDQGVKGIPIEIEKGNFGTLVIKIPSLGASFEGLITIQKIVGTFKQMNMSFPLTLYPGELKPNRPQTPEGPFPYTNEEVSFRNGEIILNGTLVLPSEYSSATPVVLMVTGSGQQNRDEEIFDHKPFAVIADALARAGIASLRYDDRAISGYKGNIHECTTVDFMYDAQAGIEYLRTRFEKVGVLGHSEGGTIALMLAAAEKTDFIISLAGMVVSGAETLIYQNRVMLLSAGIPVEIVDSYCKLLNDAFTACVNGYPLPKIDNYDLPEALKRNYEAVLTQINLPYMKHFISMDMRQSLNKIVCPVLALNGLKDLQVEAENNLGALEEGLVECSRKQILTVEGVNHLFQHCKNGTVAEYYKIEETISPSVLDIIIEWLRNN